MGQKEKLIEKLKSIHKPHPRKELLEYQVIQLIEQLRQEDLL